MSGSNVQTWEGNGAPSQDSWSDMLFPAQLTQLGGGGGGGGGGLAASSSASVADVSIYVDAMGHHSDALSTHPHWPPISWNDGLSYYEHAEGAAEDGGLYLPAGLCQTGTGSFSSALDTNTDYKTLTLKLPTRWALPSPAFVGTAAFTAPLGVAVYAINPVTLAGTGDVSLPNAGNVSVSAGTLLAYTSSTGSMSLPICVPTNGFTDETISKFAILTDEHFSGSGCLKASYSWSQSLTYLPYDHASDYRRGSVPFC